MLTVRCSVPGVRSYVLGVRRQVLRVPVPCFVFQIAVYILEVSGYRALLAAKLRITVDTSTKIDSVFGLQFSADFFGTLQVSWGFELECFFRLWDSGFALPYDRYNFQLENNHFT